ncbi:MAG: RNA polymerase sigma factor [Planctomycetales bacterium]|nr:RNA polymerase sigma factor [Planctomycetales bacterium]
MNSSANRVTDATAAIDWRAELDQHRRWLRTVIAARCGEAQAVDEIFQETAAAAVAQKSPLADATKVAPWLYQIAVRQSLMYRRKQGRKRKLEQAYAERAEPIMESRQPVSPLGWLLADERRSLVRKAMAELNPRDSEMLMLKYTEGWSYREIANRLGMSESAVESRLHRARQKLRQQLARLDVT